ncbi:MAG: SH3 domain-containing protein [Aristaeellaceae bacterium]
MKRKFIAVLLLVCVLASLIPAELSALAASQTVYVTANTLPVYKTYSTSSKVLGTMSYGESMTLLATNSSWAYVKNSSGATGYCKLSGIGTSNPNKYSEKIYINSSNVKVYKKPDTSSGVMMTLSKNASYTAVAKTPDNEWARLKNGSAYGYVQMKYISTSKVDDDAPSLPDLTTKTVYISANTLNAYKSASTSSKVLGVMSYGESMTLLATSGDWAQIRNSANAVGYCKLSGLTATNPNNLDVRVYVSSASAKVYKKPSTSADVLTTVKLNDSFTAVAITADSAWARVKSGSSYGYIQASKLSASETEPEEPDEPETPLDSTVYVGSNTLPVYASASTSSKLLGTMSYGESMTLVALHSNTWAQVRNSSGAVGYCKLDGLTIENPNSLNTTIYVTETGAKLYAKPTTSATVLGTLKQNAKYTAVAMTTDKVWLRLKNGSSYGYLLTDYASTEEVDDPTPGVTGTVYISANTLVAYSSPSTSSKSLGTMSYGESMLLLGVDDGWAKIQNSSGAVGYCKFGGLTNVNPNNLNLTMYAQSNGVKLYAKPLTTATVSKTINQGDSVTVIAVTGDGAWARVNLGSGKYAYVQTKSISETKPDGDDSGITDIKKKTVYISATTLAVYASPSTSSASLGTMSFGESLSCDGVNSTWARVINSSGTVGYCKLSGLTDTNPNTYNVTLYAQSSGVKVYSKASTSSTVLTTLSLNAKVTGVAINEDKTWIRLKNDSAYGYVQAASVATTPDNGSTDSATVNKVIALAKAQSGKPYVYGTTGPNSFDCSGFTYYVFKNAAGITLKRTSESQGYDSSYTKISAISNLKVGDLVFFNTNSDDADLCDHVGIYLGSGSFIHASSAGGKVITSSLNSGYYNRTYSWGRRVL